jgi:hypothetical protein
VQCSRQLMNKVNDASTYLKCSLVWSPRFPKYLLMRTMHVVKTLKRAPNPSTTRYPIPSERGGSPPNMDSWPLYLSKGGSSSWTVDDTMMLERVKNSSNGFWLSQVAVGKRMRRKQAYLVQKLNVDPKRIQQTLFRLRTRCYVQETVRRTL